MSDISKMTIDIPTSLKNRVKANASLAGKKLKDYVLEALQAKIQDEEKEDDLLGKMAMKAEKEGFIGKEDSKKLLNKISDI